MSNKKFNIVQLYKMAFHRGLHIFQDKMFDFLNIVFVILIVISYLGLYHAPKILSFLDYYLQIYICLFLIWRFNPFRKLVTFTELDQKIAFNAGFIIFITTILKNYLVF